MPVSAISASAPLAEIPNQIKRPLNLIPLNLIEVHSTSSTEVMGRHRALVGFIIAPPYPESFRIRRSGVLLQSISLHLTSLDLCTPSNPTAESASLLLIEFEFNHTVTATVKSAQRGLTSVVPLSVIATESRVRAKVGGECGELEWLSDTTMRSPRSAACRVRGPTECGEQPVANAIISRYAEGTMPHTASPRRAQFRVGTAQKTWCFGDQIFN
ncbi:hypothetical protein DFH08DRAFT_818845 [Mycena albidolilacea]|uniref:Uncharacterized protein n=1 Tax=Mycena albidolilacea TaxID=1033008 RepID=A0AAD6ZFB6_9AGAR|nr:hypothetical protein DFH08DRAFT_818845 [Mycena albidolilacea]